MTEVEIKALWLYMNENWPNYEIPSSEARQQARVQVWRDLCGGLDAQLVRATIASLSAREFPPTPGQIHAAAIQLANAEVGEMPCLDEAWLEFKANYKSHGPWSHPAVEAAAQALGCREFGQSEVADEMAWRAHFIKLYGSASTRYERISAPMPPVLAAYMESAIKRAPQAELESAE